MILNKLNDTEYAKTYPQLIPEKDSKILMHYIYVFVLNLHPDKEYMNKMQKIAEKWNDEHKNSIIPEGDMEDAKHHSIQILANCDEVPYTRNGITTKLIIYYFSGQVYNNNIQETIDILHKIAEYVSENNLIVCREKIITKYAKIKENFHTKYPTKYFELYYNLEKSANTTDSKIEITKRNIEEIDYIMNHLSNNYKTRVNLVKPIEKGVTSINIRMRFRSMPYNYVKERIIIDNATIIHNTSLHATDFNIYYCWYDSFPEMSVGEAEYCFVDLPNITRMTKEQQYKNIIEEIN